MSSSAVAVRKASNAASSWEAQYERDFAAQKNSGPITFTEEQRRKNKEVLSRVTDLLPFEDIYKVNDCDLIYRFLIGKHWNVAVTEKGLREYIELRKRERLDGLIGEQLHPTIGSVLCPCDSHGAPCPIYGLDKDGLPILWLSPDVAKVIAAMKQFTDEELLRGQMRAIELGRFACLSRKVDRCTYVIDLGGVSMSSVNKATLGFLKGVMHMLQVAYPEIMRRLLIFNTGWAVSAAWKVLRPFVDVRVQDKIKFESGAPTLAALQPYMAADQVHPAFGGTGKANVLDPLIEAEVRRVRGLAEGGAVSGSETPVRGPSITLHDDGSLFDFDAHALHSFYCPTPGTACPTPKDGSPDTSASPDRLVIGAPRAVSAWMANMNDDTNAKDALDMSLSIASSSDDYAMGRSSRERVNSTGGMPPASPSSKTRRASAAAALGGSGSRTSAAASAGASGRTVANSSSSNSEPIRADASADGQRKPRLPTVAIALTYGADGSITGYLGQTCVGQFRDGCLYATPKEADADSASSPATSPSAASPTSRSSAAVGELLFEAGHPIHNFYIVCDGQRNARFLLRRSRLRTRLAVYNIVGGAAVRTEKSKRHYVEGERAKLGVAVPSTDPTSSSKGDWMLYGEDVTSRSPGQQIKQLFSKTKRTHGAAKDVSDANVSAKEKEQTAWPASMFGARRPSTTSTATSPSKAKTATPTASDSADFENESQLLAANKGQTVYFYNLLTKNPVSDLFALAVAITLSWSGEMEGLKDKSTGKVKRYASDDDVTLA